MITQRQREWLWLLLILATVLTVARATVRAQGATQYEESAVDFVLEERLSATDLEADEGYFALGQQTMLVVKPGSELHAYLRGQQGKVLQVRLVTK